MKLRFLGLLSLAMAVCLTTSLVAQEEGRRGGQRGRGGPQRGPGVGGGFRGGLPQIGGAIELMSLLQMEEVREEVEMSEDTYRAIQNARPDMRSLFQASEEERVAKLKEFNEQAQDLLDEVLTPDHLKRLMGLLVQRTGNRAAANDLIAGEIGLDESEQKKIRELADEAQASMRAKMREIFQGGGGDREKFQEMAEQARKEMDQSIAEALTSDQQKALEDLKGEKFEFPEGGGFGGRFGGGRRGGGRPAGGGRPRGDRPEGGERPRGGGRPEGGRGGRPQRDN